MADSMKFDELLLAARGGSQEAIGTLVESVRTYLLLIANQEVEPQLRQKVAASDVVQDVCLLAADRFDKFSGASEGELRAWLRQVLLNFVADSRRKYIQSLKRRADREVELNRQARVPAQEITPRTAAIAKEEAKQLEAAMNRLPEDYQNVLRLRNWDLLSFDEVGRRMSRSDDAAQKLWTRAMKKLQQELGVE